jgi:hypothetical protein
VKQNKCNALPLHSINLIEEWLVVYLGGADVSFLGEVFISGRGWIPVDLACWDLSTGGQHKGWRNYFFGALEYRCRTEILPQYLTGLLPVRRKYA